LEREEICITQSALSGFAAMPCTIKRALTLPWEPSFS
jgi:hypothetical protein